MSCPLMLVCLFCRDTTCRIRSYSLQIYAFFSVYLLPIAILTAFCIISICSSCSVLM